MRSRCLPVRASWWPMPVVAMLVVISAILVPAEGRVRLGADVLARSRGGNPNTVLRQASCNALSGLAPCPAPFSACETCSTDNYTTSAAGKNGGYKKTAALGSCGSKMDGICNPFYMCLPGTTVLGTCTPPNLMAVQ